MSEPDGLMEPIAIVDTFAMGVEVEDLANGMRRLKFFAPHGNEQHVCVKLVIPAACLLSITQVIVPHAQEIAESFLTLIPRANHNSG